MIIVTGEEIELTSTEVAELTTFLRTSTGQRVIKAVAALRPIILGDPFSAGQASGYEKAIVNLIEFTHVVIDPPDDSVSNYPDLDNDAAWAKEVPRKGDEPTQGT